jgi:hypothetical protein
MTATTTASRLIDAWVAQHQRPIPWDTAVQIVAVVERLSVGEAMHLQALDAPEPQTGQQVSPLPAVQPSPFGPEPTEPISAAEQQMLDAIAAETDIRKFPAIVTSTVTDWSTTPRTTEIRDNDGRPLARIQRAMLRRIWELQGRA